MNLQQLGEDRLLQQLIPRLPRNKAVVSGAGDDCAVVRVDASKLLLLKTDCVVEGVHFTSAAKPHDVGWKAMARPLSDFAAMAGLPQFALVTLIAPAKTSSRWIAELYRGLGKAARVFDVAIVGGETSATAGPLSVSVAVSGVVAPDRCVSRSGGKVGDEIFVTGRLGGAIRGKHLRFIPRVREARWLSANFRVHAMIDLSDGIGADLPRLARASNVGFELDEAVIPRNRNCSLEQAISDGEDYELLFTIGARDFARLQSGWAKKFPRLALTRIGKLVRQSALANRQSLHGYVHFA